MNCPYCGEKVNHGATVCKTCQRDIALVTSLTEAKHALEQRVGELEAELAELREKGPAAAPLVDESASPPGLIDRLVIYLLLPTVALVGTHYLLIIKFDAKLVWLRAASIALPALFGFLLERKLSPRWFVILGFGVVVGLVAVFSMSTMIHFTDGDPIVPDSAVSWRETLEYAASMALSYLLGALLAFGAEPLTATRRSRRGQISKLANFMAVHVMGKKVGLPLEVRVQRMIRLIQIAASASTAAGAIYTGFKGIIL